MNHLHVMEELPTLSQVKVYTEVTNRKRRKINATSYPNDFATGTAEAMTGQKR